MARNPHASEYANEVVELSKLALNDEVIEGITFTNCTILGPAVMVIVDNVEIGHCSWDAPDFDSIAWIIQPERRIVVGGVGLKDCVFSACVFRRVGLAVAEDAVDKMRAGFNG